MKDTQLSKASNPYKPPLPFQTPGEELANAILHGLGTLLGIAGLVILCLRAMGNLGGRGGGALVITSYMVYTTSMILLFLASTLYHAIQHEGTKRVFQVLDHSAIYILIAGTYTPFSLVALQGALGWTIFGIQWGAAILGISLYAVGIKQLKKMEVGVYILMGWMVVMTWSSLVKVLPKISLYLLIAGGLSYTAGTIWYGQKARRGTHVIWHVFVLAGALLHWFSIYFMS